jgi:hypothetical protein
MMGADSSELGCLFELGEMISEGLGCEGRTVVEEVLLRHHTDVSGAQFEPFLGCEGLMGGEMSLKLDLDIARGGVDEDAATGVHVLGFCLAAATEESARCRTDEVVNRDALAWEDLILSKDIHAVLDDTSLCSWGSSLLLFGELASGAHGRVDEMGTYCIEPPGALRSRQSAAPHRELDAPEREVSEMVMPAQQLLLGFRKVEILCRNSPWW